jgi:hypothetical protein
MLVNVEESMPELRLSVGSLAATCKVCCLKRSMLCTLDLWTNYCGSPDHPDHHPSARTGG